MKTICRQCKGELEEYETTVAYDWGSGWLKIVYRCKVCGHKQERYKQGERKDDH